jgi:hypothetical protein
VRFGAFWEVYGVWRFEGLEFFLMSWQVGFEEEMRRAKMLLSDQADKSRTTR